MFTAVVLVVGEAASFGAFFAGQAFFAAYGLSVSLGDTGVLRAVVGGGLYLAASGLFGLAVGALLRHTAGAIATAAVFLLVLPGVTQALPGDWGRTVWKYFTTNAGPADHLPHRRVRCRCAGALGRVRRLRRLERRHPYRRGHPATHPRCLGPSRVRRGSLSRICRIARCLLCEARRRSVVTRVR